MQNLNSDAIYVAFLDENKILVHVDPKVIKAMVAFVYVAILKDCLNGFYMHWLYEGTDKK